MAALAACSQAPAPDVPPEVAEAPYPSLATVPPRPQLGYSLEQRRAVESQLVGDREHAAYMEALLDYETGRAATPPPPPPAAAGPPLTPAPAPAPAERFRGPGDSPEVEAYVKDALERDRDDGELTDFLRKLERRVPGAKPGESLAAAAGFAAGPAAGPAGQSGPQHLGGLLGGLLGTEAPQAAQAPLARLTFAPGSESLPAGAEAELARALGRARGADAGLRITGGGQLAQARTRAVAAALGRLGARPDQLDLAPGGGEPVELTLAPRRGA